MATRAAKVVDTRSVAGRRDVHYRSFDDLIDDVQRLIAGGHRTIGNWSLERIVGHLAATMEIGLDGAPFKAPWFIRLIAKPVFKRTSRGFTRPMPAGYQLPSYAAQHLIPDDTALEEAFARLRHAVERWSQEPQRHPHPVFGKLTEEEWVRLQLRHAEMHMSFVLPMAN